MTLYYSPIGGNPYGMHRVLIVVPYKTNDQMSGVFFGTYHPVLLRVVSGYDIDKARVTGIDGAKWLLTASGFVISSGDYQTWAIEQKALKNPPHDILGLAGGSHYNAVNLLQHLLVVFRPAVPSFVTITDDKIMVSSQEVKTIAATAKVIDQDTVSGKGYTFSYVLPDGFVLADYTSFTLIPVNKDHKVVAKFATEIVRKMGTDKIWELLDWEMRRWMFNEITGTGLVWRIFASRNATPVSQRSVGVAINPNAG